MTGPVRIQLSRAKGWKMPANTLKVDRSTRWGNPWTAQAFADPVAVFEETIGSRQYPQPGEIIHHLRGWNLGCWCRLCDRHRATGKPLDEDCAECARCHVDVLGRIANSRPVGV